MREESEIEFNLLNMYLDGNTVIAEWDVRLRNSLKQRIHLREVALLEVFNAKIRSLREYWHWEQL